MSSTSIFKLELCQNGWNGCLKVRWAGTAYLQYIIALKGCLYCTRSLQTHIISQEQLSIWLDYLSTWSVFEQYTLTFTAEGVHLSTDTTYEATGRINYFHSKLHGTDELMSIYTNTQVFGLLHDLHVQTLDVHWCSVGCFPVEVDHRPLSCWGWCAGGSPVHLLSLSHFLGW